MGKVFNMTFASSLTDLCEINSSFDRGVLRVCYTGDNRNKSNISKAAIESAVKTIFNCPLVCNYDRESGTFGGHDMEVVRDDDGSLRLVNLTEPVGVVPESANTWFENFEDEDGVTREYFYTEVLLWKRQEAYQKIRENGITAHSMEITVKDGEKIDGVFHIKDFEFTAFALIGETPCFEGSALELFSMTQMDVFKQQMSEMMSELKETFSLITSSGEDADKTQRNSMEGGEKTLDEKMELVAKYGINVDTLDFSIEDFTIEELTEKFEAMAQAEPQSDEPETSEFALTANVIEEVVAALSEEKVAREWGECSRYCYVDCDIEAGEVYCWDSQDWLLYGFAYSMNGDNVVINYESKKRKKYVIADFDEGEQPSPFAGTFSAMEGKINEMAEIEEKFNSASETLGQLETEVAELRKFKEDAENIGARNEREEILGRFEELAGIESYEDLKENCMDYSLDDLEDKCFAIRGRNLASLNFSLEENAPKIKVVQEDNHDKEDAPYGGIVERYANKSAH